MSERPDRVADDWWWRIALVTVGRLFRACLRLRTEGVERIPADGPAILAANHVSPLDPIAICLGAARRGRTVRFLTSIEAFDIPLIGWGLRRLQQIPIRRGARDRAALHDAAQVISNGALAGIFPEGKLGTGEAMLPGRRGTARLALAASAPVVPIGVWGMQVRWSVRGLTARLPLRPVTAMVVGEPIPPVGDPDDQEAVQQLTDRTMEAIAVLVERAKGLC